MIKKIKEWWNKPITYHVEGYTTGGPIVESHYPEHDVKTTRGKEICDFAYALFTLFVALFLGSIFMLLILPN